MAPDILRHDGCRDQTTEPSGHGLRSAGAVSGARNRRPHRPGRLTLRLGQDQLLQDLVDRRGEILGDIGKYCAKQKSHDRYFAAELSATPKSDQEYGRPLLSAT